MKIAFISTYFTGATFPLMKHLSDKGYKTDLFLFAKKGGRGTEDLSFGKTIEEYDISEVNRTNRIFSYLNSASHIYLVPFHLVRYKKLLMGYISVLKNILVCRRIAMMLRSGNYDYIYIIVHEDLDALMCSYLKKAGFKNVVVAYHEIVENHLESPKLKKVVQNTLHLKYPIVVYSQHTKNLLQKMTGQDKFNVTYFGPFETFGLFDTNEPIIKEPYVLYIGIISPYKGLSFLYDTTNEKITNPQFKIVVAGFGKDDILEKMNNDSRFVVINRFLGGNEFANLIRYAMCVVCPYVSASQSGIPQTAMVYGTPVITTKVGAFPEFIEEGKNGYLIDYGDKDSLAGAIMKVAGGKCSRGFVPEKLKWENIVQQVEDIFHRM